MPLPASGIRGLLLRRRTLTIAVVAACLPVLVWLARLVAPHGFTRIDLRQDGVERKILSAVVSDGERVTLTWRNSQFGLNVTEVFVARSGVLIQDQATFRAPDGRPPPRVSPRDVCDLYHAGDSFDVRGLFLPFRRIVYRVGEIGEPKIRVRDRIVAFKEAAGFGGRLILTASSPSLYEILLFRFERIRPSRESPPAPVNTRARNGIRYRSAGSRLAQDFDAPVMNSLYPCSIVQGSAPWATKAATDIETTTTAAA